MKGFNDALYWIALVGSLTAAIYLLMSPSTTWALAILAVPPIAVILRQFMTEKQKALWAVISILLIVGVHRGLSKDQRDQAAAQNRVVTSFQEIGQQIGNSNDQNQKQFAQTMTKFSQATTELGRIVNLESENLKNTAPRAIMAYRGINPNDRVTANTSISFSVRYNNVGNDVATDVINRARIYVVQLDDKAAQQEFLEDFNKWWRGQSVRDKGDVLAPWYPAQAVFSFHQNFTDSQIQAVQNHAKTFYYLIRVMYSDHTGRWVQDFCGGFQDPAHPYVSHPCMVDSESRRPVR